MTDKLDKQEKTNMPEEHVIGDDYGTPITYRLKSTVDAELAADSKTIRELSAALGVAYKALQEAEYFTSASEVKQALSDNAPRITEAQENQK